MSNTNPAKIFYRVKSSNDARRVLANFSYLSLLQIGGYVLPIITYPYLARVIGVEGFGKIAFAYSIITYFMTVTDWGYNFTATRDTAKCRENSKAIEKIYSEVTTSKIFLLIVSGAILSIMLLTIPYFRENYLVIALSFSIVIGQTIFPEWIFQGMEKMRLITILNLSSKILFTVLIFVCIKKQDDYIFQPALAGLGYILSGIIGLIYVRKVFGVRYKPCSFGAIFSSIKSSFDVFINNLMPNLYNNFSVVLLGFFGGSIANGYLDGANKFYSVGAQFLNVLSRAFFPFLTRRLEKHYVFSKIKILITIVISVCLIVGAPTMVHYVLDDSFESSIIPLRILAISLIFHSITNIYGTNYLIIIGKERILRNLTIKVSIIGMLSAIPLIYYLNYIGAALTIAMSRIVLGSAVYITAKKQMRLTD